MQKKTMEFSKSILAALIIVMILSSLVTVFIYFASSETISGYKSNIVNPYSYLNHSSYSCEIISSPLNPDEIYSNTNYLENKTIAKNLIGVIEHGDYTIALIDNGNNILEIISRDSDTWDYILLPECLNKMNFLNKSTKSNNLEAGMAFYRVKIELPEKKTVSLLRSIDIYDVWCENRWSGLGFNNLLHTEGRYYINKGQNVVKIIDKSYSSTSVGFYERNSYISQTENSKYDGLVTNKILWSLWSFPIRTKYSVNSWIDVDIYYNTTIGTSSDKWISTAA